VPVTLFDRQVIVQLGTNNAKGKEFSGLRVTFDVQHTDGSAPNKAKIEIYNLAASTVATMQAPDAVVRLLVGYASQGGAPRLLFEGSPVPSGVKLDRRGGVDRVLVVEAMDGGRELAESHVAESFETATTSGQLFRTLAEALGVPLGNVTAAVEDVSFPHGIVLQGPVRDQMDRVASMSDALWGVRDGALQVWRKGATTGESSVVFSSSTGNLIGSPTLADGGVEVTGLLAPTLRPGKPFRVESQDIQGNYVCTECKFRGDSGWGNDFYVTARGRPL
jgi:hypothetical protein